MCSPDFNFNPASGLCEEKCSDGKRYVVECDDGNTVAGDGCTFCKIDQGWTCRGGSPNSPDFCSNVVPSKVTFLVVGQIRYQTKVVLNVKIDYLPKKLLQSNDCNDRCSQVLVATVTQGDKPISVKSSYVAGSSFTFNLELEFGRPYMNKFTVQISINQILAGYFQGCSIVDPYSFDVNPAQLALARKDATDFAP
jgi:cysteine-rich repeat protein